MANEIYLCSNKCRLCLSNKKFQIPIFGEVAQEMQIFLKIRTCLPVQVSQDDELPKSICYKCVSALEQSYKLWKLSSESEAVLKSFSSKVKQDLPESNIQYQSFCSSPYNRPSQANNRKLLLPTGVPITVESDSDEEQIRVPRSLSALRGTSCEQMYTKWLWESDNVMMDTSPDFLDSLSEPSTGIGDTSPDFLESLSEPTADISDSIPIKTMDKRAENSPEHKRWRSISLFGTSANTWRDFYRPSEMFRSSEPTHGTSHNITERDIPSGQATISPPNNSRSNGDALQAMNERNCKAISQRSDMPRALLNFLHTQKPHMHDDNTPQQGPKGKCSSNL